MSNFISAGVPAEVATLASSTATFPASGVVASGTGTTNTIPKFTNGAGGVVGNSAETDDGTTFTTTLDVALATGKIIKWNSDTGLSRGAAGEIDLGNGTQADKSGTLKLSAITMGGSGSGGANSINAPSGWTLLASGGAALTLNSTSVEMNKNVIFDASTSVTQYNGIATVGNGLPAIFAAIDTTGLTANVGASTLYVVPASGAGLYEISTYVVETTAGSISSTLPNAQIVFTDRDTSGAITIDCTPVLGVAGIGQTGALTSNTIGTASSGVIIINAKASTTIQYQTVNYSSNAAGMAYALRIKLKYLG